MINYINDSVVPRRLVFATTLLAVAFVLSYASNAHAQSTVTTNGGTIGRIPKWSTTTLLGDSAITESAAGNIGIGNNSPLTKLQVAGGTRVDGTNGRVYLGTGAVTNYRGLEIIEENATTFSIRHHDPGVAWQNIAINPHGGNVGIGTNNPTTKLDVVGTGRFQSPGANLVVKNTTGWTQAIVARSTGQAAFIAVPAVAYDANNPYWAMGLGSDGSAGWSLETYDGLNMANRMRVLPNGNVGIGTSTPSKKLDVSGDINATGTITGGNIVAKYQDVAEWVPASELIPVGTVVILDSTKSNHVIASTQTYDTRVAGVISEKPGLVLGESGDNKVLVATTGRVRIKVDATRGPIHIGDLLVTSDISGMAMKSEPVNIGGVQIHRPGTLVGKALEPLAKGQGEILVLLSLQ